MTPVRTAADRGTVTAELALGLPAVVLLLAVVLTVGSVVSAQVRCLDAARAAARAAARGDSAAAVRAVAVRLAPAGASVAVSVSGRQVTVGVTSSVRLPLLGAGPLTVRGRASADREAPVAVRRDTGAGSVLVLGVSLVAIVLAGAVAQLGQVVLARHRAEAAADLAALGTARAALTGDPAPCLTAARLTAANGARLVGCRVFAGADGWSQSVVGAAVPVRGPAGRWGPARAVARAGPAVATRVATPGVTAGRDAL